MREDHLFEREVNMLGRETIRRISATRAWMPAFGGEVLHEEDMKDCCRCEARRSVREGEDSFACFSCGTAWEFAPATEMDDVAFVGIASETRKSAA